MPAFILGLFAFCLFGQQAFADTCVFYCPDSSKLAQVPHTIETWTHNGALPVPGHYHDEEVKKSIDGYGDNNQCANLLKLNDGKWRLFCCSIYAPYFKDMVARSCIKTDRTSFSCDIPAASCPSGSSSERSDSNSTRKKQKSENSPVKEEVMEEGVGQLPPVPNQIIFEKQHKPKVPQKLNVTQPENMDSPRPPKETPKEEPQPKDLPLP